MTADPKSFQLQIDSDPRLAAAAGGVARYVADAAGLASSESSPFQKAVVAACLEAFKRLGSAHPHLTVTTIRFPDRIEVRLAYEPALPATSDSDGKTRPDKLVRNSAVQGVDDVHREVHAGAAITRLTKYLRTAPSEK